MKIGGDTEAGTGTGDPAGGQDPRSTPPVFLSIFLFFTIWKLLAARYGQIPEESDAVMVLMRGPPAVPFWVGEIGVGLLLATVLLVITRAEKTWALVAAPLMVIIGMFFARYDFVVAGQLVPVIGQVGLWTYALHMIEILTVIGAISLFLLLYYVGNPFLPAAAG